MVASFWRLLLTSAIASLGGLTLGAHLGIWDDVPAGDGAAGEPGAKDSDPLNAPTYSLTDPTGEPGEAEPGQPKHGDDITCKAMAGPNLPVVLHAKSLTEDLEKALRAVGNYEVIDADGSSIDEGSITDADIDGLQFGNLKGETGGTAPISDENPSGAQERAHDSGKHISVGTMDAVSAFDAESAEAEGAEKENSLITAEAGAKSITTHAVESAKKNAHTEAARSGKEQRKESGVVPASSGEIYTGGSRFSGGKVGVNTKDADPRKTALPSSSSAIVLTLPGELHTDHSSTVEPTASKATATSSSLEGTINSALDMLEVHA